MILRPDSLEMLESQLKKIPENKRRLVIVVGRHPNEGTINIAKRYHAAWEKYGAVVVRVPAHWTPHGFWRTARSQGLTDSQAHASYAKVPQDFHIVDFISKKGFEVPVVSFHATPISPTMTADSFINDQLKRGLIYARRGNSSKVPFESADNDSNLHRNELLVEFWFKGAAQKPSETSRYAKRIWPSIKFAFPGIASEPEYLDEAGRVTRKALSCFSKKHIKSFTRMIKKLSETGLVRSTD